MNCNTTQKELGGKDLLLRTCLEKTYSTIATGTHITSTANGAEVGDIVAFQDVGASTSLDASTVANPMFYFVINVIDADNFEVATTPDGTAIVPGAIITAQKLDLYQLVGGLRSKSFSFSSESIDISSQESNEWKTMLDNAGMRSASFSGSGVYTKQAAFAELRSKFLANKLTCLMLQDTKNNELIEGCFKLSSLELSGDYDAESQYSISGDSSGPVVFFTAS